MGRRKVTVLKCACDGMSQNIQDAEISLCGKFHERKIADKFPMSKCSSVQTSAALSGEYAEMFRAELVYRQAARRLESICELNCLQRNPISEPTLILETCTRRNSVHTRYFWPRFYGSPVIWRLPFD